MNAKVRKYETGEEKPVNLLAEIYFRVCALRALAKDSDYVDSPQTLISALLLDDELDEWSRKLTGRLTYDLVPFEGQSEDACSDLIHNYQSPIIANMWNAYRAARLLMIRLALKSMARLPPSAGQDPAIMALIKKYDHLKELTKQLVQDICASVPYLLGYQPRQYQTGGQPRAASAFFLLWPLYLIVAEISAPPHFRLYAIQKLSKIGSDWGIRQATVVANLAVSGSDLDTWDKDWKPEDEVSGDHTCYPPPDITMEEQVMVDQASMNDMWYIPEMDVKIMET
jgi:hypothetical protein